MVPLVANATLRFSYCWFLDVLPSVFVSTESAGDGAGQLCHDDRSIFLGFAL